MSPVKMQPGKVELTLAGIDHVQRTSLKPKSNSIVILASILTVIIVI